MAAKKQDKRRGTIYYDKRLPNAVAHNEGDKVPRTNRRRDPADVPETEFRRWRLIYNAEESEHRRELLAQNLSVGMPTLDALQEAGFKVGKRMESEIHRVEYHLRADKVLQARVRSLVAERGNLLLQENIHQLHTLGLTHDVVLGSVLHVLRQSMSPANYDRDGVLKAAQLLGDHLGTFDKANSAGGNTDPRLVAIARQLEELGLDVVDKVLGLIGKPKPTLVTIDGNAVETVPEPIPPAPPEMKADQWKSEETALKR